MKRKSVIFVMFAIFTMAVACDENGTTEVGSMEMPLETTGSDGAIYSLPDTTIMYVTANNWGWNESIPSGVDSMLIEDLTPATYTLRLGISGVSGTPDPDQWTLMRNLDGEITEVEATLLENPIEVDVIAGGVAPVTYTFEVENVGNVVFETGHIIVDIDVDDSTAPATRMVIDNDFHFTGWEWDETSPEMVDLEEYLALDTTVSYNYRIELIFDPEEVVSCGSSYCFNVTACSFISGDPTDEWAAAVAPLIDIDYGFIMFSNNGPGAFFAYYASSNTTPEVPLSDVIGATSRSFVIRGSGNTDAPILDEQEILFENYVSPMTWNSTWGYYAVDYDAFKADIIADAATVQFLP